MLPGECNKKEETSFLRTLIHFSYKMWMYVCWYISCFLSSFLTVKRFFYSLFQSQQVSVVLNEWNESRRKRERVIRQETQNRTFSMECEWKEAKMEISWRRKRWVSWTKSKPQITTSQLSSLSTPPEEKRERRTRQVEQKRRGMKPLGKTKRRAIEVLSIAESTIR